MTREQFYFIRQHGLTKCPPMDASGSESAKAHGNRTTLRRNTGKEYIRSEAMRMVVHARDESGEAQPLRSRQPL